MQPVLLGSTSPSSQQGSVCRAAGEAVVIGIGELQGGLTPAAGTEAEVCVCVFGGGDVCACIDGR